MNQPKFKKFAEASQKGKSKLSYKYIILYILLLVLVFGYYFMNKNMAEQSAVETKKQTTTKQTTFILNPPEKIETQKPTENSEATTKNGEQNENEPLKAED